MSAIDEKLLLCDLRTQSNLSSPSWDQTFEFAQFELCVLFVNF